MDVRHILLWRDVKVSAIVFVSGFVLLSCLTQFSVVSVITGVALVCLTPMLAFRLLLAARSAFRRTEFHHPFKRYLDNDLADKGKVDLLGEKMAESVIRGVSKVRSLFLVEDLPDSLKLLVALYLVSYMAQWFSGITMSFIVFVGAFTVPKLYDMYQDDILTLTKKIETAIDDAMNKINAKFPSATEETPKKKQEIEGNEKDKTS